MKVSLRYLEKNKNVELPVKANVADLLEKAGINSETVIVRRDKEVIPETENLKNGDKLEALRIVSGG